MADISGIQWSSVGLTFSEADRLAAAQAVADTPPVVRTYIPPEGGSMYEDELLARAIARATGGSGLLQGTGSVDPEQMMADGFTYVNGRWVRQGQLTTADLLSSTVLSTNGPSQTSSGAAVIGGGSVLGYQVPNAPAVLLPSFVGGRLGSVEMGAGMRPESGGRERVEIGTLPKVRF